MWLFGSDGGVPQVSDSFRQGVCPEEGIAVSYAPLYQRQSSELPTNTVLAFVAEPDGTLWFGTALGLTRLQDGEWTPVPFQDTLTIPDDVVTLEGFSQAIAAALSEAEPLDSLTVGGLSLTDLLETELLKEDFIFRAVQDGRGAIWTGTLGGGLRRTEVQNDTPQDTLHLTREEGLGSNLILSLAMGPDNMLWVGTDEGVSRIDTTQEPRMLSRSATRLARVLISNPRTRGTFRYTKGTASGSSAKSATAIAPCSRQCSGIRGRFGSSSKMSETTGSGKDML